MLLATLWRRQETLRVRPALIFHLLLFMPPLAKRLTAIGGVQRDEKDAIETGVQGLGHDDECGLPVGDAVVRLDGKNVVFEMDVIFGPGDVYPILVDREPATERLNKRRDLIGGVVGIEGGGRVWIAVCPSASVTG